MPAENRANTSQSVPALPPLQSGPQTWRYDDVADSDRWTWTLTSIEIDELLTASDSLGGPDERDLASIAARDFPLPAMAEALGRLRRRLTHGLGFELIRGFPSSEVSERHSMAVFAGLGAHLGSLRSQNAAGDLIGHVRNVGADAQEADVRIYQTAERQTFHTDSSDVVGLLCLETAAKGGESLIVSAASIYNEMLDQSPVLAGALFEPIATDRRGEVPDGSEPFFTIPVFSWFDQSLTVMYQRQYIESAVRFAEAPELTPLVVEALDLFDEIANRTEMYLGMQLEIGDMQFVHNHSLLHDRTGFTDKPGSPRHLLRLWLSVPGDRGLPPVFAQRFGSTTVGARGGIMTATP